MRFDAAGWIYLAAAVGLRAGVDFTFSEPGMFQLEKAAGDELAHDIYTITLGEDGRVLVSGPGYIRWLDDRDGDGRFESASDFHRGPASGCQGMVFHGGSLYTTGGRGLERYDDRDRDGAADGPPELLLPLSGGEHGAHALRIGPDGFLYFLGGNHCGLQRQRVRGFSPVKDFHAGVFCRMDLQAQSIEVWCDGMRNAYDFDFTPWGDAFAWDSDSERSEGLPWYRPCRLYLMSPGADCGWRCMGTGEVPAGTADTAPPVAVVHRGSPTGVACYRQRSQRSPGAFPDRYHGGLFACDWTFGRVYFFRLAGAGPWFQAEPEMFLAAAGEVSFAPTDVTAAPDGSLLITSGGRGIAGNIYRVSRTSRPPAGVDASRTALDDILAAPDPLAAWSRARWAPAARTLGPGPFAGALAEAIRPAEERIRALEILVEHFPGAAREAIAAIASARAADDSLAAESARWLRRFGEPRDLLPLLERGDGRARRHAVESAMWLWKDAGSASVAAKILALGPSPPAIAALAHAPPESIPPATNARERLLGGFALVRSAGRGVFVRGAAGAGLDVLTDETAGPRQILDALRLLVAALDRLKAREDDEYLVFDPEWEKVDLAPIRELVERVTDGASRRMGISFEIDLEALRLCAKARASSPIAAERASALLGEADPGRTLFLFWCLAQLEGTWSEATLRRTAAAALDLPRRLRAAKTSRDEKWGLFQRVIWERLGGRRAELVRLIVEDPRFGEAEHLDCAAAASPDLLRLAAARLLARSLPADAADRRRVLDLVTAHAPPESRARVQALLREALALPALRAAALEGLARDPAPEDCERFVEALEERDPALLKPAIGALDRLAAPTDGGREALALIGWGLSLDRDPSRVAHRDRIAARLAKLSGDLCAYQDGVKAPQPEAFACWARWIEVRHPGRSAELKQALDAARAEERLVESLLEEAPWPGGDPARGKLVYEKRGCGACHHLGGVGQRVGPDLAGVARRLDLRALLVEIAEPSRVVPERYCFNEYTLRSGERVQGTEIYTSRAALLLVTREGRYRRLDPVEIAEQSSTPHSLMPSGLLAGLTPAEVADLVAYLRSW